MHNLTEFLFKPYSLVVIHLENGETIQGTVVSSDDERIVVKKEDESEVVVDEILLSQAEYCYTGFPSIQERVVPQIVVGNGTVSSYSNGTGLIACKGSVSFTIQRFRIQRASFLDDSLKKMAEEDRVLDVDVLYAVPENQPLESRIAYIIQAGPLDDVLDKIAMLATQGKIEIANKFCKLVKKQYPEDEDVKRFNDVLSQASERIQPIDFYETLPPAKEGYTYAYGRIYEIRGEQGRIIDVFSHKRLFFYKDQLFGGLEDMETEELIGLPVVYSVKRSYNQEKCQYMYQARTIMPTMSYKDIYSLAKDLPNGRKVTACDMLRIILNQNENADPVYQKEFDYWYQDPYAQNGLWDDELWDGDFFSKYKGKSEQLFLPVTRTINISLKRLSTHEEILTELTKTPEAPSIMPAEQLEILLSSHRNELEVVIPAVEGSEDDEEEQMEDTRVVIKELPSILPTLDNCPEAEFTLKEKATIMVAWREGTLFMPEEEQPYKFRMEDIIDLDLRRRAEVYSTKFIQDEPVVCQLSRAEHRATYISSPMSVIELLSLARDAIINARGMDEKKDRAVIYEEYTRAFGFTSLVLDAIPGHKVARDLQVIAQDALRKFSDTSYTAPFNAVKPCGEIVAIATKKKQHYYVHDPLFLYNILMPKTSLIDRDYEKPHIGDDLVYSVYQGTNGKPVIRFACLARPSLDLIGMAEEYEKEESFENAWGIAMNVLDADPTHPDALAIIARCESMVDKETVEKRQQVVRENLFAQAQTAATMGDNDRAVLLFERIIKSQDENRSIKEASVLRILEIYSMMLAENPDNKDLKNKYKKAGEKYILKKHFSPFSITSNTLRGIEVIIQFFYDMGDIAGLISAYQTKVDLLLKEPSTHEIKEALSQTNATIAWYYLMAGEPNKPAIYAERANSDDEYINDLGRVCEAIIKLRYSDTIGTVRANGNFSSQSIPTLSGSYLNQYADKVYKGRGEIASLTFERFALLCAIIKEETIGGGRVSLLHYVGRYLATLTGNDNEYKVYVASTRTVPDDCSFVRQVFKCLRYGPAWRFWMDIRLVCMLSQEASCQIASAMFCIDQSISANVLIRSDVEIYTKPSAAVFARGFSQWRGATLLAKYNDYIKKTEDLQINTDLDKCVEYFRDLSFETWMSPDDQELINEFRRQLPGHMTSFITAETSRAVKTTSREITDSISEWLDYIKERPTLLTRCAFYDLMWQIRKEVEKKEGEQHFSEPVLKAKVLTTSVWDADGSIYLEVEIHNKDKKAEPIQECHLRLLPSDDIIPDVTNPVVTYSETEKVFGDETILYILRFKVNQEVDQANLSVSLRFDFKVKNTPQSEDFSLKFKPLKKWTDIENFFNPGAPEYTHFYGRQAYIKKVVSVFSDPGNTPHFFIYGQKRSGKSSVLFQIQKQLQERIPSAILVKVDFLGLQLKGESDLYYLILKRILQTVDFANKKSKGTVGKEVLPQQVLIIPKKDEMDYDLLLSRLWELKTAFKETRGWEESRLILFIDEFTVAYEGLLAGLIPKEFMHRWKSLQAEGLFGAVLVGQDVLHSFINETEGPNAFDILDKERLNYLEPEEARRLIIETMENLSKRKDVFIGDAVDRILYYSASSAHYTKWVCSRLVDYMNARKQPKVTKADIDAVVWRSIQSMQPTLLKALFDPLIFPGLKENLSRFTGEQTLEIMDIVADEELANSIRGCRKNAIVAGCKKTPPSVINDIISDLVERGVLNEEHESYKIKLKLFSVWYQVRNTLQTF